MDNCSARVSDDVIHMLTEVRVCVGTSAAHTTQVCQVLDLTLFGVLKQRPRYESPFNDDNALVQFIMKVCHDCRRTMVQPNM
jgi:hypothetical protein